MPSSEQRLNLALKYAAKMGCSIAQARLAIASVKETDLGELAKGLSEVQTPNPISGVELPSEEDVAEVPLED